MINLEQINAFKERIESLAVPVLSVYCDADPSKEENKNMAWIIRIKNALKDFKSLDKKLNNGRFYNVYCGLIILPQRAPRYYTKFTKCHF